MMTEYSAALSSALQRQAIAHLVRADGQEDLCFAIWYPSRGASRYSALVDSLILPRNGERRVHGNASFLPAYFERALGEAMDAGGGLAFMHSHPGPGWQGMSDDDVDAERTHGASTLAATGLPLVGLTIGNDGAWSARFWEKTAPRTFARHWCSNVRVVGDNFQVTFADQVHPKPRFRRELSRTVSSWGPDVQAQLARLRIGVIGAGSVGAIVAEGLARTGVAEVTLIDFDTVEDVNLDRLLHATTDTARAAEAKVVSLGRGIRKGATAEQFVVRELEYSVTEEEGYRAALDCDILFSCVDRPWPRAVLNFIAYAHLVPVVDGGIQIETTRSGSLRRADWKAHLVCPDRRCLECLGQFDPGFVQTEREGRLDDPEYIKGLPESHALRRNENVFAFSLNVAGLELLQMLTMVVAPLGIQDPGRQAYHFVPGVMDAPAFGGCDHTCLYPSFTAKGDRTGLVVTGSHVGAEAARRFRASLRVQLPRPGLMARGRSWLARLISPQ